MNITENIKRKAIELGFDLAGVTNALLLDKPNHAAFQDWLRQGFAGQMEYMHKNLDKRVNPAHLLKAAKSVIVVALNYHQRENYSQPDKNKGQVASYACYQDYHSFMKERLYKLVDFISSESGSNFHYKVCVDSTPIAERALACRAGLGFIGKNHMLINPKLGCRLFLGEIITDMKLHTDEPEPAVSACYNCRKCIDACPTGALRSDGWFDANRCINYLTIEYKGQISHELAKAIGNRIFGCEECIAACPCQKNAPAGSNKQFKFHRDRRLLDLQETLELSEDAFIAEFADSPVKRTGLETLKRNAQICIDNLAHSIDKSDL